MGAGGHLWRRSLRRDMGLDESPDALQSTADSLDDCPASHSSQSGSLTRERARTKSVVPSQIWREVSPDAVLLLRLGRLTLLVGLGGFDMPFDQ